MATQSRDEQCVMERMVRIERSNTVLRALVLVGLVSIGSVALIGWTPDSDTVEAQQFVLKDKNGKTRAMLAMTDRGPLLGFYSANGTVRAGFGDTDKGPIVTLHDEKTGIPRIGISVEQGEASISLSGIGSTIGLAGANGNEEAYLSLREEGPTFELADKDGVVLIRLQVTNGEPLILERNKDGKRIFIAPEPSQ